MYKKQTDMRTYFMTSFYTSDVTVAMTQFVVFSAQKHHHHGHHHDHENHHDSSG